MRWNVCILSLLLAAALTSAPPAMAVSVNNTFGNVVTTVGGHPADIALDESRGRLYIANFTGLRIDVMSTATNAIQSSINLYPNHPGSVALSRDSRYLVATLFQNGISTPQGGDLVAVIDLNNNNAVQTFATGDPPLAVRFISNATAPAGLALIATTTSFYLLDPVSGYLQLFTTLPNLAKTLPQPDPTFPPQVIQTAMGVSTNGTRVWGVSNAGTGKQPVFFFDFGNGSVLADTWLTSPPLLPRVSVSGDGSYAMIGWSMFTFAQCPGFANFMIPARYPGAVASTNVTGHVIDSKNGLIYAQVADPNTPAGPPYYPSIPTATTTPLYPVLSIMDADNLTVRDKLYLPENLVGTAVLNSAATTMYAISDSGVTVLPVGSKYKRLAASAEDVLLQSNFCNRNLLTGTFTVSDVNGNSTDFSITTNQQGVSISPSSGVTPATVTVSVQPGAIVGTNGTLAIPLQINSGSAKNVGVNVRLLFSNPDQDQRGAIVNVPGRLSDVYPDVRRNRYFVLRQDQNQLLAFDGNSNQQVGSAIRTGTTPTQMSISPDGSYLMVGAADSQLVNVYDLTSLQKVYSIMLPPGHWAHSIAQSNMATLMVIQNDGSGDCLKGSCAVDRVDWPQRCAYSPQTLGIWQNDSGTFPSSSVVAASPDQRSILLAAPSGTVAMYSADVDAFVLGRKDFSTLAGGYAISSSAIDSTQGPAFSTRTVIGNNVFDSALVPQGTMDASTGSTVGFAFTGPGGYRVTENSTTGASGPSVIQNLPNVLQTVSHLPTRTVEAAIGSTTSVPFTRTVAPMTNSGTIVLLTTSGVTVLPNNFDAATAPPAINAVVSAADGSPNVAPGGLVSVYGSQMTPNSASTSTLPLPTALAQSCVTVNGTLMPLLYVSGGQINAQLPSNVSGTATMAIHTPGGISSPFTFSVSNTAPTVFMSGSAGPETGLAVILRFDNGQLVTPTNPIHPGDTVIIYATGLGSTFPAVQDGFPAPTTGPLSYAAAAPSVTLGGVALNVFFAGLAPGYPGVYQINATVPGLGVPQGLNIPLSISQGGGTGTTLNVRVVKP